MLLAKRRYECHQGQDMHKKSKENYQMKKKERQPIILLDLGNFLSQQKN